MFTAPSATAIVTLRAVSWDASNERVESEQLHRLRGDHSRRQHDAGAKRTVKASGVSARWVHNGFVTRAEEVIRVS
jgi:hypothetical protein